MALTVLSLADPLPALALPPVGVVDEREAEAIAPVLVLHKDTY